MTTSPRYAVVFKTHFWDEFVERQFQRLCKQSGTDDVFIIVDETHGNVNGIPHPRVLRMTEQTSVSEGYFNHPAGRLFWHNTDYQLYHFIDRFPEYAYIVTCEYDCVVNIDISVIVQEMANAGLDFAGERIRTPASAWYWAKLAQPYYAEDSDLTGRLVCFAIFSRKFALQLQAARRDHTSHARARELTEPNSMTWPNNEAFVGAEIARNAVPEAPLSAFGDTSHYDWAPPFHEQQLSALSQYAFVHPVLEGARFVRSIAKLKWNMTDLFLVGTRLHTLMEACEPAHVVPPFLEYFIQQRDFSAIAQLRLYAEKRGADMRPLFNIARGKPATQSSISQWSRSQTPSGDAGHAVSGKFSGDYAFHTDFDEMPWWCVDLEWSAPVREICIYNRMSQRHRARSITITTSRDLLSWTTVYQHEHDLDFGGVDGNPLSIKFADPREIRFIRIHLIGQQLLHLEQVEIYV